MQENILESIKELKEKFKKIKNVPFHKSLRKGSTGIGYTFESLIGKKEDTSYQPDFKGIELKTKFGYSKSPLTLFGLAFKRDDDINIYKYLVKKLGYFKNNQKEIKHLAVEIYTKKLTKMKSGLFLTLKINLNENKIKLVIIDEQFNIIDNNIYWNLNDVYERLLIKLNYMALIKGYPYKYKNEIYYKYTSLNIYKLKGTEEFLKLLQAGYIFITISISYDMKNAIPKIKNCNISFRLNMNGINYLFKKIY